jgi:hypothetical protein
MVFVEGVHGTLQRGQIPGAYSTEFYAVLNSDFHILRGYQGRSPCLVGRREFAHHVVEIKARGLLPNGVLLKAFEPFSHNGLRRDD